MKISAVVLTKNEEKNIRGCLATLSWCDELIIIDDFSSDETAQIARKLGAKVYTRKLGEDFSTQRNFGLDRAQAGWVLFIDADERVSPSLRDEIIRVTSKSINQNAGFFVRRADFLWGRELRHGETSNIKLLRLARKNAGRWRRRVHETWEVAGPTAVLHHPLLHYPHPTLREFLADINFMSTLHAKANLEEGKRASIWKIIFWPRFKFRVNWILKLGFLDGAPGFMLAMLMSFHSFLGWSKLWLIQRK